MVDIVKMLKAMPDYIGDKGRKEEEILRAEKAIDIAFAQDYREYLKEIGLACFDGRELTGLTEMTRLDVVSLTLEKRGQFGDCTSTWYVIEDVCIDGIVIWQDSAGNVYETAPSIQPNQIAASFAEYIENC